MQESKRVLVVDDNVDAAETLTEFLGALGHEARMAHDGKVALQIAAVWRADLVLLDIGLPGMDGFEVARALRRLPVPPGSVVALSGYGEDADRKRSVDAGIDAHLVKPIELGRLEELLARPQQAGARYPLALLRSAGASPRA